MKLNLGCGDKKKEGYINIDTCGMPDMCYDLSTFPWPFEDSSADEIFSSHFLEHVLDYERTILEIHRILKPDGIIHFHVPHFRNPLAVWHLHKWSFSTGTCERLCEKLNYQWEGRQLFRKEKMRMSFVTIGTPIARPLGWLANIWPLCWDWLGFPTDEIEFVGRKVSD